MTSTVDHRGNRSVTDEGIQRQMEALKTQYRKELEEAELEEAFLRGFNVEE